MSPTTHWRTRIWRAHPELLALGATGGGGRSVWRRGPLVGADLGVDHPWGVQLTAGAEVPSPRDAEAGLSWCASRGGPAGWRVGVPQALTDAAAWSGLVPRDTMGVFATDARTAGALAVDVPDGVTFDVAPGRDDVVAGYGGWMADPSLAAALVTPADLDRPDRRFVVVRLDGVIVGAALVWWAAGTGYVSGLGVVPAARGRGVGRALTATAARLAAAVGRPAAPDVVWMHATDEGAPVYARLGFIEVDTEVQLGPT